MIQLIDNLPSGTLGFRCSGRISGAEMQQLVIPAIEQAMREYDRIKALVVCEPAFEGLSLEAVWDDTNLGLRHWDGFERLALVCDQAWLRHGMRALSVLLPYPLRLFSLEEFDTARRWLSEALGTIHSERQGEVISVSLIGQLDREVYARANEDLAQLFSEVKAPRVLLDLRSFEGWMGLSALREHLALIRDYRRAPERVALVSAAPWRHLAERLLAQFSGAETRLFSGVDLLEAQEWICAD